MTLSHFLLIRRGTTWPFLRWTLLLISFGYFSSLRAQDSTPYWNSNTPLVSYRLPLPPVGYQPTQEDLDGDGDPDIIRSVTIHNTPIIWIDDDDDMKVGDLEGDTDSDCLLIDVNKDGKYGDRGDVAVDWIDTDGDGDADMQAYVENSTADNPKIWGEGHHYFWVLDTDHDNVFNYIDWNTFEVRAWLHEGGSNFLEDYNGQSTFLKLHSSTFYMNDVRLNWENPFLFYDYDEDGLSEMAIRVLDDPTREEKRAEARLKGFPLKGKVNYIAITLDLDNDNGPGNELDFDMSFRFEGPGFDYMDQVHTFENKREPAADHFFIDPRWRQTSELIYPDHETTPDLVYNRGEWEQVHFVYDEDDDCERWERVELYEPYNLFKVGALNGGLDNNRQSDAIGDRGEWDLDFSGEGNIYRAGFDGRIHLHGAEWGAWRVDQLAFSYQGYGGIYDEYTSNKERLQLENLPFATFRYDDTDANGFFDQIAIDLNGDTVFDKTVSLKALAISDECEVISTADLDYEAYRQLHTQMAADIWSKAEAALAVAKAQGVNTSWYAFMKDPKSENQQYRYGFWLQFYVYMDLLDRAKRGLGPWSEDDIDRAYWSGNWQSLQS